MTFSINSTDLLTGSLWWAFMLTFTHLVADRPKKRLVSIFLVVYPALLLYMLLHDYFYYFMTRPSLEYALLAGAATTYGLLLFVVVCELMELGLGRQLTRRYGEEWLDVLDYAIAILSALSGLFAIASIRIVEPLAWLPPYFAPFVWATSALMIGLKPRIKRKKWHLLADAGGAVQPAV